jgi:hypothetical protein
MHSKLYAVLISSSSKICKTSKRCAKLQVTKSGTETIIKCFYVLSVHLSGTKKESNVPVADFGDEIQ